MLQTEVVEILNVPQSVIYRTINTFKETDSAEMRHGGDRRRTHTRSIFVKYSYS